MHGNWLGGWAEGSTGQYARVAFRLVRGERMQRFGREGYCSMAVRMGKPLGATVMAGADKALKMHKQVKVQRDTQPAMHCTGRPNQWKVSGRGHVGLDSESKHQKQGLT